MMTIKAAMTRLSAPYGKIAPAKLQEAEDAIVALCSVSERQALGSVRAVDLTECLLRVGRAKRALGHK